MVYKFDFLVIGSGIAGMSFALKVAHKGKSLLFAKPNWKKPIHSLLKEVWHRLPILW